MSIAEFFKYLSSMDIKVSLDDGNLKCNAPQDVLTDEIIQDLRERKTELIEFLASIVDQEESKNVVETKTDTSRAPLSFSQKRLWFLDHLNGPSSTYNIPLILKINRNMDVGRVTSVIQKIVDRHEVLRSTYHDEAGEPYQEVHADISFKCNVIDLRDEQDINQDEVYALIRKEINKPFNLACDLMLRTQIIKVANDSCYLTITMHHIISDEWSLKLFANEFVLLYEAMAEGAEDVLPPLELQYKDYAIWQNAHVSSEEYERQLSYWKQVLADVPYLKLPYDYARPGLLSQKGNKQPFTLPDDVAVKLSEIARRKEASLFMVLLGLYYVLLNRISRQNDICVGSPIAGRSNAKFDGLIGFFVNNLALRISVDPSDSLSDVVAKVKETALNAYENQDIPFEAVVDGLDLQRTLSFSPVFQTTFSLNHAVSSHEEKDLGVESVYIDTETSKFDLMLNLFAKGNSIQGAFEYSTDLFDKATIEKFISHFSTIAEIFISAPDTRVRDIDLLSNEEKAKLLTMGSGAVAGGKVFHSVAEQFARHASASPDRIALRTNEEIISYSDLDRRADQIAGALTGAGVGAGTMVGLYLPRSTELIASIIAVWKVGGTVVALDPALPAERIVNMINALTLSHVAGIGAMDTLKVPSTVTMIDIVLAKSNDRYYYQLSSMDVAYVIFTSGSTGEPNAVSVNHANLAAVIESGRSDLNFSAANSMPVLSYAGFDISYFETFLPLSSGGAVVVVDDEALHDPALLLTQIESADYLHAVPSLMGQLMEAVKQGHGVVFDPVMLMTGGDIVTTRLLQDMGTVFPDAVVVELYGPTEGTIISTFYKVSDQAQAAGSLIGKPLAHANIYVLDDCAELSPIGVTGEICIGGSGVTNGYSNNVALTADCFIPNAFAGIPGDRLYRSGDLGRWNSDGVLEFLGRADNQVKVRGFRIELGDIEHALAAVEGVAWCVVTTRADVSGQARLVAYVVCQSGVSLGVSDLRQQLNQALPDYMVPSLYVFLDELPLNKNGKVDVKALPAPENNLGQRAYVAPESEIETKLAKIWQSVLGVQQVGIHDNFFELGGDSILSIQIVSRAGQQGLSIKPRDVFEHQTIAELALKCDKSTLALTAEQGVVIGEAILTPIQSWFFSQEFENQNHWNHSILLNVPDTVNQAATVTVVKELIAHHDVLRMRYQQFGNEIIQKYNSMEDELSRLDVAYLDLSMDDNADEVLYETCNNIQGSLSLSKGPIFKVALFDLGERGKRMLIVVHHLVMDGVSWRILLEDVQRGFEALAAGRAPDFGLKTTSFKSWAEGLVDYVKKGNLDSEFQYWSKVKTNTERLPLDYPEGENRVSDAETVTVSLTLEETRKLLHEANKAYGTDINDFLLSAVAQSLSAWIGSDSVTVDLEGHGREDLIEGINLSRTVGWFTSKYPVTLNVTSDDPRDLILSTKEQLRQVPNYGLGFGLLKYLGSYAQRDRLGNVPNSDLVFNYLGQFDSVLGDDEKLDIAQESSGEVIDKKNHRTNIIDINSWIGEGKLYVSWSFSDKQFNIETIEKLSEKFVSILTGLIEHASNPNTFGYSPSDFPLAKLTQRQIDAMFGMTAGIESVYPLSPMQEGMIFHSVYSPESGVYITQPCYELAGDVNVALFESAWQHVIKRHDALRSTFIWEGIDRPLQVVHHNSNIKMIFHDWSDVTPSEVAAKFDDFLNEDRKSDFDLKSRIPMRMILIRMPDDKYQFVWTHHHVLLDGWSIPIVLGEVFQAYESLIDDTVPVLAQPGRYEDYIGWLGKQNKADAKDFWETYLSGLSGVTPLAMRDLARKSDEVEYRDQGLALSFADTETLDTFAKANRLTLNTLVQTAWGLLLSRYSGESDVCFGVTVSGRPADLKDVEGTVGLFINTVPTYINFDQAETALQCVRDVQAQQLDRQNYEWSSLVDIKRWSPVDSSADLFESVLVYENFPTMLSTPAEASALGGDEGSAISGVEIIEQTNLPLTLLARVGETLSLKMYYDASQFSDLIIERLLTQLSTILVALVENADAPLSTLNFVSEDELECQVHDWNQTQTAYRPQGCVCALFEAQVERTPDAVALRFAEEQVTYARLNERANQLAHHMIGTGVCAEDRVALFVNRSVDMVVSMLAVLKAGAAYVPLDPEYPEERIAFILKDSNVKAILTTAEIEVRLPPTESEIIILGYDFDGQPSANPEVELDSGSLAYVIYTSGSTGVPKGVMVTHSNALSFLHWASNAYSAEDLAAVLATTSICFDLSVFEIFLPLAVGGSVVLVDDALSITQEMPECDITLMNTVPSAIAALLNEEAVPTSVRVVNLAGEALAPQLVDRIYAETGAKAVYDLYGPSEDTTYTTRALRKAESPATIGRPIDDTRIYLLDASMMPVPVGCVGEIYVTGAGITRGYLGRADLTAERYLPDPFNENGGRLYRTGDLARYDTDGRIEYVGRADHQVKVRGYRVELGEIESALRDVHGVSDCVVLAREDVPGEKRLVAYVVSENGSDLDSAVIRETLGVSLPQYMIPSIFVLLNSLPLLPNGKIDRNALPKPDTQSSDSEYVAARNDVEEKLVGLWQDVLGAERVGVLDEFFEYGGDSILAMQLVSRVRDDFEIDIELKDFFEYGLSNIEKLAEYIETMRWVSSQGINLNE